ncbi:hypothetical protein QFZ34_003262 [Phyllobacterium ifriqiyense]|uniref:Uncharacterized protein n=1 Tax=Phyllobacterium ifriqiyense TaxID=314238 RepID=A0ABU0SDT0_9HYPH|nr:hypothetical protein [Phyllobacterium ifriqiyense]
MRVQDGKRGFMNDEQQKPIIDLHESEWVRTGKREPILGPNGEEFLWSIPLAIGSCLIAKVIIGALWPLLWPH